MRKPMDLRKTEAGSFADGFGREERIEHFGRDIVRDAYAIILDRNLDMISFRNHSPPGQRWSRHPAKHRER